MQAASGRAQPRMLQTTGYSAKVGCSLVQATLGWSQSFVRRVGGYVASAELSHELVKGSATK